MASAGTDRPPLGPPSQRRQYEQGASLSHSFITHAFSNVRLDDTKDTRTTISGTALKPPRPKALDIVLLRHDSQEFRRQLSQDFLRANSQDFLW